MKHGSTQVFDPWNKKKDATNASHPGRNRDISTRGCHFAGFV